MKWDIDPEDGAMNTHVTATHLQDLLDSSLPDPALILQNGAPTIVGSSEQADENQVLVIVTRAELREQLPQDRDCSQSDLEFQPPHSNRLSRDWAADAECRSAAAELLPQP
ncbi:hypothetical protein [Rhodococcus jostii]|uniref:Uncharacterized protein n=1 Tax=Rhodococcus jostii TaxID=132919 RepID=A0A1H5MM02_RHOJO|nr:hypothetical protein [Rhodococcus jostii]SEE90233.1 hypothetical protein SAMN04490220_9108 [Rhodococcus jostii]